MRSMDALLNCDLGFDLKELPCKDDVSDVNPVKSGLGLLKDLEDTSSFVNDVIDDDMPCDVAKPHEHFLEDDLAFEDARNDCLSFDDLQNVSLGARTPEEVEAVDFMNHIAKREENFGAGDELTLNVEPDSTFSNTPSCEPISLQEYGLDNDQDVFYLQDFDTKLFDGPYETVTEHNTSSLSPNSYCDELAFRNELNNCTSYTPYSMGQNPWDENCQSTSAVSPMQDTHSNEYDELNYPGTLEAVNKSIPQEMHMVTVPTSPILGSANVPTFSFSGISLFSSNVDVIHSYENPPTPSEDLPQAEWPFEAQVHDLLPEVRPQEFWTSGPNNSSSEQVTAPSPLIPRIVHHQMFQAEHKHCKMDEFSERHIQQHNPYMYPQNLLPHQQLPMQIPIFFNNSTYPQNIARESIHSRSYQRQYSQSREDDKTFPCTQKDCGKVYAKLSHLKAHHRRHTGEKPFVCNYQDCSWKFSRSDELARHKRSHSGVKPYRCTTCDKRFSRSDHLAKHQKVHRRDRTISLCNNQLVTLPNGRPRSSLHLSVHKLTNISYQRSSLGRTPRQSPRTELRNLPTRVESIESHNNYSQIQDQIRMPVQIAV